MFRRARVGKMVLGLVPLAAVGAAVLLAGPAGSGDSNRTRPLPPGFTEG